MARLETGLTGTAAVEVTEERTATAVGSGLVPVYATPQMVALMEMAAVAAVQPHLSAEETTVGTRVEVAHLAATPVGMTVRATATLTAIDGRLLTFRVEAWDDREKVGEGTHLRAVVSRDRFVAKVAAKRGGGSYLR